MPAINKAPPIKAVSFSNSMKAKCAFAESKSCGICIVRIKISKSNARSKHDSFMYFFRMMLMLAAIRQAPVNRIIKPPPGMNEVSIPLKKSLTMKWFMPIMPNGIANRMRPAVESNVLFVCIFKVLGFQVIDKQHFV